LGILFAINYTSRENVIKLHEHNFINIKIMETLNREWIVDKKIVRPKNEMVGHTGFVVSARFLSN